MEEDKKTTRPVAAFDLDGSLVRKQILVLLYEECFDLQIFRPIAHKRFRKIALEHRDRKIPFESYDRQIIELFVERIKKRRRDDLEFAAEQVYEKNKDWLYVFSKTLLARLKRTHECITITGAMTEVVSKLAPYWGFEQWYATELEVDATGCYTGRDKALPVANKQRALLDHVAKAGADLADSVALGDTGSDIPMLSTVDFPIAFNPNEVLGDEAEKRGWPVVIERKDRVYVLAHGTAKTFRATDAEAAVTYLLGLPKPAK
ncbi:MAG TPA: HAD-IB family phosphatase [Candidatus Binatia bacterium]|jgi:HAD superfamily hydrolase (TIGR01490 family)|nr:HAD-IB family phosphatase [Candidatus Binatia bacterium]